MSYSNKRGDHIAIEESNHGRFPEVFVSVGYQHFGDILPVNPDGERIFKKRKGEWKNNMIGYLLRGRHYRHLLIEEEFKKRLGPGGISVVVLTEFISYYSEYFPNLCGVHVDGEIKKGVVPDVYSILEEEGFKRGDLPNVLPVFHGDSTVPLINMADYVAHFLYKQYDKNPDTKDFESTRLYPNLEYYVEMFERLSIDYRS